MPQEWQPASKERHIDPSGYLSNRTIAALCSPTGGAITVLRVSGDHAINYAETISGQKVLEADARVVKRVWLRDEAGKKIDDAMMLPFFNPKSFTGENVVEFFLHGSPMIAQKVLDELFRLGARMALPGEFSFRAVKNGKMMLSQAEAVKELIQAENDFALDLALEKLSGSQHELIDRIRTDLMQLVTLSEVGIDFSDQDLDEVSLPRLKGRLKSILSPLRELQGSFDRGKRFLDGIPVSIFGLPNAGKSSFFNALLGEDRSIVSDIAGTTRDVIREKINLKGPKGYVTFKISDTAGLRKSSDQIEEIGIERSLKAAQNSDVILVVIDGLRPETDQVFSFLKQVNLSGKQVVGLLTKRDLISEKEFLNLKTKFMNSVFHSFHFISSQTLDGIKELSVALAELAEVKLNRSAGEVVLTQIEHVQAVERSLYCLERADQAIDLVLFATDIRHGMNELGPLIGETLPDDVLGKIFSDFCIGK